MSLPDRKVTQEMRQSLQYVCAAMAMVLVLSGPVWAGEELIANGEFKEATSSGAPAKWVHQTKAMGVVQTHADETPPFVEIGVKEADEDSFIQQIAKLPEGAKQLKIALKARWKDIKPGEKGYQTGFIQGRFTKDGKETGKWIDLLKAKDTSEQWAEKTKTVSVPADVDGLMIRMGLYKVKAGRLDVAQVSVTTISAADLAVDRAKYRPAAEYGEPVSDARFAKLAKGVNINNWLGQPYNGKIAGKKGSFTAEHFQNFITDGELRTLRKMGMTHIRLPVEPMPFFNDKTGELKTELLGELDKVIQRILAADLAVIVDCHPKIRGSTIDDLATKSDVCAAYVKWWGLFAAHLAKFDPEYVFLELLNEPGGSKFWVNNYPPYQDQLIMAVRAAAPKHTIIANAGAYQLPEEIIKHDPHPDRNVVYAVHYYKPSQFSHQGAVWMKDWYHPLRQVPWPLTAENLGQATASIDTSGKNKEKAEQAKKALAGGVKVGSRETIETDFAAMAEWAKAKNRRLVIGEFGVYRKYAAPADVANWLEAVRSIAEKNGMGWSMWELTAEFGFMEGEPGQRKIDNVPVKALGLTPVE